jgi:hypothetical protein
VRKRLSQKSRLPIVLVVGLVIVIGRGRRIEHEDDDECEDESRTGLFQQPPRREPRRIESGADTRRRYGTALEGIGRRYGIAPLDLP